MERWEEFPLKTDATSPTDLGAQGDGAGELLAVAPFTMRPLLLPLPPTGSATFAQAWTRQVVAPLLWRQFAQAWVAVAGAIDRENESLRPSGAMALLLLLAPRGPGSRAGLPAGLPRASMGTVGLLPRLYGKGQPERKG